MTDVPPPPEEAPKPKAPRGRPRRPKGYDEQAIMSDAEVARRVDVRADDTPRAPIERAPVRDRRAPVRRPERTGARDSLLLIGLVIVGLVAVRLFLPDGPLTASATATPGTTQAAVVTATPAAAETGTPTGGLITLPPTAFVPTASPAPITEPPITATPVPTPTLRPGETPHPTPKPTKTPTPTPTPTSTPFQTPPPGTATVIVVLDVINDDGGDNVASDWTMAISGEVGIGASPNHFPGSESGTTVTVTAGLGYQVNDNNAVSGYLADVTDPDCHPVNGLTAGTTVTCTITRNDRRAHVNVTIAYDGPVAPDQAVLGITGANASPTSVTTLGTTSVALDSNASWSVTHDSGASGYSVDSTGTCSSSGLNEGQTVSCTYTFTLSPAAPARAPVHAPVAVVPFLPLLGRRRLLPHRWRSTRAG